MGGNQGAIAYELEVNRVMVSEKLKQGWERGLERSLRRKKWPTLSNFAERVSKMRTEK